jgi:hypothetical protein
MKDLCFAKNNYFLVKIIVFIAIMNEIYKKISHNLIEVNNGKSS